MPLMQGHSDQSFNKNVKTEMGAGKPGPQALAIAYAVKRRNMKAKGGMIQNEKLHPEHEPSAMMNPSMMAKAIRMKKMACGGMAGYADGGEVEDLYADPDFLSDEDQMEPIEELTHDPADESEGMNKKNILSKVMNSLSNRHMGSK